jgi:hypothetical protein
MTETTAVVAADLGTVIDKVIARMVVVTMEDGMRPDHPTGVG